MRLEKDDRDGLLDRRGENGTLNATSNFQQVVYEVLWG